MDHSLRIKLPSPDDVYDLQIHFSVTLVLTHALIYKLQQDIEEFSFITQLAGLTDHLSVAARLVVSTGEEES